MILFLFQNHSKCSKTKIIKMLVTFNIYSPSTLLPAKLALIKKTEVEASCTCSCSRSKPADKCCRSFGTMLRFTHLIRQVGYYGFAPIAICILVFKCSDRPRRNLRQTTDITMRRKTLWRLWNLRTFRNRTDNCSLDCLRLVSDSIGCF